MKIRYSAIAAALAIAFVPGCTQTVYIPVKSPTELPSPDPDSGTSRDEAMRVLSSMASTGAFSVADLGIVYNSLSESSWPSFLEIVEQRPNASQAAIDIVAADCSARGDLVWDSFERIMVGIGYLAPERPVSGDLSSSEIVYERSFKLDKIAVFGTGSNFFDEGDLAYDPDTDKLYLWSKDGYAEISIPPDPGIDPSLYKDNPSICPRASMVGTRVNYGSMSAKTKPAGSFGGFEIIGGRFCAANYEFYNVDGSDDPGIVIFDINGTNISPGYRVGPPNVNTPYANMFHANKAQQIVMRGDPRWISKYAPDRDPRNVAFGFRQRGAGAFGGAKGPGLFIWDLNSNLPAGSSLNGKMLLSYQGNEWPAGYRNAEYDGNVSGTWVYGKDFSTVIYFYTKGHMTVAEANAIAQTGIQGHTSGPNWYGAGPYGCSNNKGWHAEPYTPEGYMYDADIFGEVYKGNVDPRSKIPYYDTMDMSFVWKHPDTTGRPCRERWATGATYDPNGQRMFVLQLKAYTEGNSNPLPVIHVLKVR